MLLASVDAVYRTWVAGPDGRFQVGNRNRGRAWRLSGADYSPTTAPEQVPIAGWINPFQAPTLAMQGGIPATLESSIARNAEAQLGDI